jgi:carbohydrate-selective porin OprB
MRPSRRTGVAVAATLWFASFARAQGTASGSAQRTPPGPAEDVEQVTAEAQRTPQSPILNIDRPLYQALQANKKELSEKYGINWALEDTLIYQATSGGVDPNDAMVNTLGLFATWKIFRDPNGKDFGGLGFQFESRSNHVGEFTELRDDLGTLWSPNDSTSGDYSKINQLWWGQRFADGRLGLIVGKIDPGAHINTNRFAGSGNTQFFGQPFATNPARSFPDNGFGFMLRAEPTDLLYLHFTMADSDANGTHSPFTTIGSRWLYAGEVGLRPNVSGLGPGNYRVMLYQRDAKSASEFGWSLSADQNLSEDYGVFLRYGGNDGDVNAIEHLLSGGLSFLAPFGRREDQAGIAVSYTHPSDHHLRDAYSAEAYYRVQLTQGIELSGSAQLIKDPSASDQDTVAVFGIRLRVLY